MMKKKETPKANIKQAHKQSTFILYMTECTANWIFTKCFCGDMCAMFEEFLLQSHVQLWLCAPNLNRYGMGNMKLYARPKPYMIKKK